MTQPITLLSAGLALALAAPVSHAQDGTSGRPDTPPEAEMGRDEDTSRVRISFRAEQRAYFSSDLRGTDGDVYTARSEAGVSIRSQLSEDFSLDFGFGGGYTRYEFDGANDPFFTSNGAIEDAYTTSVRLGGRQRIDETWSVVGGGFVRASLADGADFEDALEGGGFIAAGYRESDDFSIDFGVLASSRLEDDPLVVPYVALTWAIDDRLTLTTTGIGARLDAKIDEEWSVFLRARYESFDYRLDDDFAPAPGGVMRDESFPIGVGVEYAPSRKLRLRLEGGVTVARELEFFDDDERELRKIETDPGAYLGIRVSIAF
jgi:hypothetical protein